MKTAMRTDVFFYTLGPPFIHQGVLHVESLSVLEVFQVSIEENLHIRFSESTLNVVGTQSNGFVDPKSSHDDGSKPSSDDGKKVDEDPRIDSECNDQENEDNVNIANNVNAASTNKVNVVGEKTSIELPYDPNMPALEDDSIFDFTRDDEDDGV
ncbi:hypothetical protein Tco_0838517, partial [Tanacetum coccineum]